MKLGFIVADDKDEIIIEVLARRILPESVQFHIVPSKGFHSAYITVFKFLEKSYNHIIILFDTDSADQYSIEHRQQTYGEEIRKYKLQRWVTFCPVVPQMEAWLLGNYIERPEIYRDPEKMLAETLQIKELTLDVMKEIAQTADIELMKKRNASFASFVDMLQNIEEKLMNERISIDSETCNGLPYIRGTQIPVHQVIRTLAKGNTTEELLKDYPSLKPDDILACLDYAASVVEYQTEVH